MNADAVPELPEDRIEVPISALEHYSYCPRQCALIHVEQTFEENVFTILGQLAHRRVDSEERSISDGVRSVRGIPLWSDRLGLTGKADLVEFGPTGPYPIEYKVGRRHGRHPDLQLCAQALCLEEMLDVAVLEGAIYYQGARRRHRVQFTQGLRDETLEAISAIRELLRTQTLPSAPNDARCPNCSLVNACLPLVVAEPVRLRGLQGALFRPMSLSDADA